MGMLTPILIRNDALHVIRKNPDQLSNILLHAANSHRADSYGMHDVERPKWWQFWKRIRVKSIHANPIEALRVMDAQESNLVLISGNTWRELGDKLFDPEVIDEELEYIEDNIKESQRILTFYKRVLKKKKEKRKEKA